MKYSIFLVAFPFGDISLQKVRPVLCLSEPIGKYNEVILAYISSKTEKNILETDLVLSDQNKYFSQTGLKTNSVVKLHKIMTFPTSMVLRKLGTLSEEDQKKAAEKIQKLFG